ncbi:MAG: hypothetical protein KC561_01105 [Myxococcales bacterium]|nr:hypothetical protein [Myxococcales bacterium]
MDTLLPWELGGHLPWHHFTSPAEKWAAQPTFVIGEYLFICLALLGLWHAKRRGRAHLLVWVAALVAGTANDLIFMALPMVDNFWQAQATIMITPRLPLYIPCVYVCFMYYPTVLVWRLDLGRWARAALSGLAAISFYCVYDIVGAKFLWWTWHDTDPPIANRLLGVPIGSTMWVIVFVATFAFLVGGRVDKDPSVGAKTFAKALALVALTCTTIMVLQITVLQQLDGGVPGPIGLVAVIVVYGAIAARGVWRQYNQTRVLPPEPMLMGAFGVYFGVMTFLMVAFSPESHQSESVHQTYGQCHVEQTDITGMVRYQFLCADDYDEDFDFACAGGPPPEGAIWYTVCGRAHTRPAVFKGGVAGLSLLGLLIFGFLTLSRAKPRRVEHECLAVDESMRTGNNSESATHPSA